MKVWVITGASRGIGLQIARAALDAGHQVVATGRTADKVGEALRGYGDRVLAVELDVTDQSAIDAAVEKAVERFGRIDVLVNNAGYGQLGTFEENSPTSVKKQFATNVFGVFDVTRTVLPIMRQQRSGHVITIASIAAFIGIPRASVYCASKFAIGGWSEALAQELLPFGIKVTAVHPGHFRTDFLDESSVDHGDLTVADYAEESTAARKILNDFNHHQAGDPAALGNALVKIACLDNPPVHFVAGSDAVQIMSDKLSSLAASGDEWRRLSISMDITAD